MKNSTYAYTSTVNLSITHPTRELSYLAEELRKVPNSEVGKGVKDGNPKNIPYEDIKTSDIGFELDGGWHNAMLDQDMPEAIESVVDAILPYKELLLDVVNDGGEIRCNVGWHMNSHIGTSFSPQLLSKLAELKISLNISVYMNDAQQNKYNAQIDKISAQIRDILHTYDPSKIVDKTASLSELHQDPYQDLFNVLPYLILAYASSEQLEKELKEELSYFDRTNTAALKDFKDYGALAEELSKIEGKGP